MENTNPYAAPRAIDEPVRMVVRDDDSCWRVVGCYMALCGVCFAVSPVLWLINDGGLGFWAHEAATAIACGIIIGCLITVGLVNDIFKRCQR